MSARRASDGLTERRGSKGRPTSGTALPSLTHEASEVRRRPRRHPCPPCPQFCLPNSPDALPVPLALFWLALRARFAAFADNICVRAWCVGRMLPAPCLREWPGVMCVLLACARSRAHTHFCAGAHTPTYTHSYICIRTDVSSKGVPVRRAHMCTL